MLKGLLCSLFLFIFTFTGFSQTANIQIIHNSPSPTVDIWVNDSLVLPNFEYRTATPFIPVPSNTQLNVGIAPSPSDTITDIIANFPITLDSNTNYIAVASGIVGNAVTPFTLNILADAKTSTDTNSVEFVVNHGSTDAPAVDVIARDVGLIVDSAAYGDITGYIKVPADNYILDITPEGLNDEIVASFAADLDGLGGGAAFVFASGFLSPGPADSSFGIFAVFPDGTVAELPAITNTARLQVIHNSPSPTVDIWVNGQPFLTGFEYRTATPYVDVPGGQTFQVGIAPSPSDTITDIIATFDVNLPIGSSNVAIASGIVGNPTTPFTINLIGDAKESTDAGSVEFIVNHGSTDAPAVDVIARGVAKIVDNLAYGATTDYISVPPGAYTLDITPTGVNDEIVASYAADLTSLDGGTAVVFASGFLSPGGINPPFGLFAALPDGMVIELPSIANTARLQVIHNSPSPTVDIWVNGQPFLTGFEYRTATPYVDVPGGQTFQVGIAPSPSDTITDIIATFDVNLPIGSSNVAIASGIVGDPTTPFTINLIGDAKESTDAGSVEFIVNHGSTDAPAVDVIARGVAKIVDNLAYGQTTDYIPVPPNSYTLDVTPTGVNDQIVASYTADLSSLDGNTAVVFASGFLAPGQDDPAFGLFAALADGTVVPFPAVENKAMIQIIHNSPSPTVDIWLDDMPLLTNVEFRQATAYLAIDAGKELNIGVAPSPSSSVDDIIASFPVTLTPDVNYVAIAGGIVGDPTTPFNLFIKDNMRTSALNPSEVDFIVHHGSPDAPAVDVIARGVATIVEDAEFGDITDYIVVPADDYILDLTPANDNDNILASYTAALTGLAGGSAVVFASGFLTPDQDDPAFGLWVALADGTTFPLDLLTATRDLENEIGFNFITNPIKDHVQIRLTPEESGIYTFSLIGMSGKIFEIQRQQLFGGTVNEIRMDTKNLPAGSYIVKMLSDQGKFQAKLIVKSY